MKLLNYIKNLFGLCKSKPNSCCGKKNIRLQKQEEIIKIDLLTTEAKHTEETPQETKPERKPRKHRSNTAQGEKGHGASDPKKEDNKEEKTPAKKKRKYRRRNTQNKKKKDENPQ